METITQEISTFIEEYSPLHYSSVLLKTGFTNSKNVVGNQIIKKEDGTIIFSEQNVKDFCKKYNLYYADTDKYTGLIPEQNIKKIEEYKPHQSVYEYYTRSSQEWSTSEEIFLQSHTLFEKTKKGFFSFKRYRINGKIAESVREFKSSYIIVAPKKDFNVAMDEATRTMEVKDPVIFEKYYDMELKSFMYQLITCWGPEQATPELQKDKFN